MADLHALQGKPARKADGQEERVQQGTFGQTTEGLIYGTVHACRACSQILFRSLTFSQ